MPSTFTRHPNQCPEKVRNPWGNSITSHAAQASKRYPEDILKTITGYLSDKVCWICKIVIFYKILLYSVNFVDIKKNAFISCTKHVQKFNMNNYDMSKLTYTSLYRDGH